MARVIVIYFLRYLDKDGTSYRRQIDYESFNTLIRRSRINQIQSVFWEYIFKPWNYTSLTQLMVSIILVYVIYDTCLWYLWYLFMLSMILVYGIYDTCLWYLWYLLMVFIICLWYLWCLLMVSMILVYGIQLIIFFNRN